jgi:hypothetical protein
MILLFPYYKVLRRFSASSLHTQQQLSSGCDGCRVRGKAPSGPVHHPTCTSIEEPHVYWGHVYIGPSTTCCPDTCHRTVVWVFRTRDCHVAPSCLTSLVQVAAAARSSMLSKLVPTKTRFNGVIYRRFNMSYRNLVRYG